MLRSLWANTWKRSSGFLLTPISQASSSSGGKNQPSADPAVVAIIDYEDPVHLPIAVYPKRPNEKLEQRKQRLVYQSRKRGMLENDLLLSTFAAKFLKGLSPELTEQYDNLINGVSNDWDIYYWATNAKPTPTAYDNEIMRMLKEHVANAQREKRLRQPDL